MTIGLLAAVGFWYFDFSRTPAALARARALADSSYWEDAGKQLRSYLRYHSDDPDAVLVMARVCGATERPQEALEWTSRISQQHSLYPQSLYQKGDYWRMCFRLRNAEEAWRDCIERATAVSNIRLAHQARTKLAELCSFQQRKAEAASLLWEVYPDHPTPWRVLKGLLALDFSQPPLKDALRDLRGFVEADPSDYFSRRVLARKLAEDGQHEEGKQRLEQCVQERPDDLQAWTDLLWIALEQHELEDAQGVVGRLPSAAHTSAKLWHLRGRLCSDQNRLEESVACLNEAVRINPYQWESFYLLARVRQRLGQAEQAAEALARFSTLKRAFENTSERYRELTDLDDDPRTFPESALCRKLGEGCLALGDEKLAEAWFLEAQRPRGAIERAR